MGPLKLLDFVGLDVALAIGETLHDETREPAHEPPSAIRELVRQGKLGKKAGEGFYTY
jgi:3-hydroxybutyryl-CoA dehydrogenase